MDRVGNGKTAESLEENGNKENQDVNEFCEQLITKSVLLTK